MNLVFMVAYAVFLLCGALVLHTFLGYPLLTFVLAALFPRKVIRAPIEPRVSFIISAYNEEGVIGRKLEDTLHLDYPRDKLDIIVASDGSTDRTDEIVRSFADRGARLIRTEGRVGKTATLNAAAAAATGDILVCSDATSVYDRRAIRELVAPFADPRIGGLCGRVVYEYGDDLVSRGFRLYQSFIVRQRMNESRFGHQTQLSGAIHAIRRECHVPCPAGISDEEWHALDIALQGRRTLYVETATAQEESRSEAAAEFRARVRMAMQCFAFTRHALLHGVRCTTLLYHFQNFSSKVLRWLLPFTLIVMLVTSSILTFQQPWLTIPAAGLWCFVIVSLLSIRFPRVAVRIPGLPMVSFLAIVLAAYAVGGLKLLLGGRATTAWEPQRQPADPPSPGPDESSGESFPSGAGHRSSS